MSKTTVTLPEKFDISGVESIKGRLQKALEKDASTVEINASAVEAMDSAGLQILISFDGFARKQGKEVKIIKVTDAFKTATELLGTKDVLPVS